MSYPRVKIVQTQPRIPEGYVSVLEYWRCSTGSGRKRCCAIGCGRDIQDCAIIQIKEANHGNEWHFLPFCSSHLRSTEVIPVESLTLLVRANQNFVGLGSNSKVTRLSRQPQNPQLVPFPEDPHHRQPEHSYAPQSQNTSYQQNSQMHPQLLPFPEYVRQEQPQSSYHQEQKPSIWEPQRSSAPTTNLQYQQPQLHTVNQQHTTQENNQQEQEELSLSSMISESLDEYNKKQEICNDEEQNSREALTLVIKIILIFFYWLGTKIYGLFSQKQKAQ